jgi:hypothetical protein
MIVIDNDNGDDDVDDVDKDWAADGYVNENDDFNVEEGYVVANVRGEDFDAHDANDSDDYDLHGT